MRNASLASRRLVSDCGRFVEIIIIRGRSYFMTNKGWIKEICDSFNYMALVVDAILIIMYNLCNFLEAEICQKWQLFRSMSSKLT